MFQNNILSNHRAKVENAPKIKVFSAKTLLVKATYSPAILRNARLSQNDFVWQLHIPYSWFCESFAKQSCFSRKLSASNAKSVRSYPPSGVTPNYLIRSLVPRLSPRAWVRGWQHAMLAWPSGPLLQLSRDPHSFAVPRRGAVNVAILSKGNILLLTEYQITRWANHAVTHEQSLITKILTIHFQANIDFSLCCTFQRLVFSKRWEILPTDRQTDTRIHRYTNRLQYAPWLRPPRHNNNASSVHVCMTASVCGREPAAECYNHSDCTYSSTILANSTIYSSWE